MLEFKSTGSELKDVDVQKGIVTGYFSAFGNVDLQGDIIVKGAFKKTLSERGAGATNQIFHLWNHDSASFLPLGKPHVLLEDQKGLYFETSIVKHPLGVAVLEMYDKGIINEHSVGFSTMKESKSDSDYREILEAKLYEGSSVLWGANPDTPYTGMKSLTERELTDKAKLITKSLRSGNHTDETYQLLEVQLQHLIKSAFDLGNNSVPAALSTDNPSHAQIDEVKQFRNLLTVI